MLQPRHIAPLIALLNDTARPLVELGASFEKAFENEDHFAVGCALMILVQESDLLEQPASRIAALFLLYHMYKSRPCWENPFLPLFLDLLAADLAPGKRPFLVDVSSNEKLFVQLLLEDSDKVVFSLTASSDT